jgi:secreted PhoX family phosphatase
MTDVVNRRAFLKRSAAAAGGAVVATSALQRLTEHAAVAQTGNGSGTGIRTGRARRQALVSSPGYGELARMPDQRGMEVLALPSGFEYVTFGWTGSGLKSQPGVHARSHDGMGSFAHRNKGITRLVRNHELRTAPGDTALGVSPNGLPKYDELANGGCITLDFHTGRRESVREFTSIAGTHVNCAGGVAYGAAGWITCEETVADARQRYAQKHGYAFFVPATGTGKQDNPRPLRAMGRFAHEAVAVDPRTGIVYETEDAGNDSGFYRFIPANQRNLAAGGVLEMLAVRNSANYDTIRNQELGASLAVEWVRIPDPDPDLTAVDSSVFDQGADAGGARFNRLEGIWWDDARKSTFFNSTSGGNAGYGQVWEYVPGGNPNQGGELVLRFESPGKDVLDSPDNLNVTPRGGILLCEDDATGGDNDAHPLAPGLENVNRLIGLDGAGGAFEFAVNVLNDTEFAGACWSPDAQVLFVNVFGDGVPDSGMTCAIYPPESGWGSGLL